METTITEIFEEQVEKTPDNIALIFENKKFTYKQLNEKSNKLANYLKIISNDDIKADDLIGLILERDENILISILAVLKSGAAYVPIDPSYPDERIKYILQEINCKIIISNCFIENRIDLNYKPKIINLKSDSDVEKISNFSLNNFKQISKGNNLAYVLYTSGSTGDPKGVMIEQKSYISLINNIKNRHFLGYNNLSTYSLTNFVFDIFGLEYGLTFFTGGTLELGNRYCEKLDCLNYNFIQLTPSLATVFLNKIKNYEKTKLIIGGENLSYQLAKNLVNKKIDFINAYGPTETTIWSSTQEYNSKTYQEIDNIKISIGKQLYMEKYFVIINKNGTMELINKNTKQEGELYISGIGLARGYLNRPDLTKKCFIANPFQTDEEKSKGIYERLYKTGDLVRHLPDGSLEFIGRNDFQIKLRGFRIELEEIENVLTSYENIKKSIVIVKELDKNNNNYCIENNKILIGYYLSDQELNQDSIINYMKTKLPEFMIPKKLMHINKIPVTINGKLNKKELPDINLDIDHNLNENYVAPSNDLEKNICKIWSDILTIPENKIGINDDFFKLGGDSLLFIRLISELRENLNLKINSLSSFFKNRNIYSLVQEHNSNIKCQLPSFKIQTNNDYLLSFAQERLYFLEKYDSKSSVYNIFNFFEISNLIDLKLLVKSFNYLLYRHESLRTIIISKNSTYYQKVLDLNEFQLVLLKKYFKNLNEMENDINKIYQYKFKLEQEIPIKIFLYELKVLKKKYIGILINHMYFDGWSYINFMRDLNQVYKYYKSLNDGYFYNSLNIPNLNYSYKEFSMWQRKYLENKDLYKNLIDFWREKLSGFEFLKFKKQVQKSSNLKTDEIFFEINQVYTKSLKSLAKELNVSLFSLLLSAFFLMLKTFTSQNDIVIGTPFANRHYKNVENLIGFFVNLLPVRIIVDSNISVVDYIKSVNNELIEIQLNQDLPLDKVLKELGLTGNDTDNQVLFSVIFGVEKKCLEFKPGFKFEKKKKLENKYELDSLIKEYTSNRKFLNLDPIYDLCFRLFDQEISIIGNFVYSKHVFSEANVKSFIDCFKTILAQFSEIYTKGLYFKKINEIKLLGLIEENKILNIWNSNIVAFPEKKLVHQLFEEQVEKTPDNIALIFENKKFTYKQLNEKSNKLANYLKIISNDDIKADDLIGLILERDENILISILAVLKSGAAYVPIDPSYPDERIKYILQEINCKIIIVSNQIIRKRIENLIENKKIIELKKNPEIESLTSLYHHNSFVESNNLAYVIFTSGTTGHPKGVMIEHRGVFNLIKYQIELFELKDSKNQKNSLWFASYVFDQHVWDVFAIICSGHCSHLINEEMRRDQIMLKNYILKNQIKIATIPPAVLSHKNILPLDILVVTGDKSSLNLLENYKKSGCKILNGFGPTETTVGATINIFNHNGEKNIGYPFPNMKCFVLDADRNLLPIGAIGELYISGIGLARGYLNRPDLTKKCFIANPFQTDEEKSKGIYERLYKTGDLVRHLPDGSLEFIGRNDFQIKLRGFRIELEEIENVLTSYENIKKSIVIVKELDKNNNNYCIENNKVLIGYYLSDQELNQDSIINYMKTKLPEFMIPKKLMHINKIPVTINGKLNKKELPDINLDIDHNLNENYVAPSSDLEKNICKIWSDILTIPENKIGINDDFFKLGGDSILSVHLTLNMNEKLNLNLSIKDIFIYRSINNLIHKKIQQKSTMLSIKLTLLAEDFENFEPYVIFNENKDKILFCFPPSDGGLETYFNNIAKYLTDFKLVLFNNFYFYLKNKHHTSYTMLSKYYLHFIKQLQPNGPYNFFGWCFGGSLAFEIALSLTNRKEYVSSLILVEAFFNLKNSNLKLIDKFGFDFLYYPNFQLEKEFINNILLYKAIKPYQVSTHESNINNLDFDDLSKAYEYFFKTLNNNLDIILDNKIQFEKIEFEEDHNSWIYNSEFLFYLAKKITQLI